MAITPSTNPGPRTQSIRREKISVGLNVAIGIVAAVVLAGLLNYLSQRVHWRKDFQTLGQYSLSDRTGKILGQIHEPVAVTVVYTATDKQKSGKKYGPRVLDYCREMQQANRNVVVRDVSDDEAKADVLIRLRTSLEKGEAGQHLALIRDFQQLSKEISDRLAPAVAKWRGLRGAALLNGFRLPVAIAEMLDQARTQLDKARDEIVGEMSPGAVPKYADLADRATTAAKNISEDFDKIDAYIQAVADLQKAVADKDGAMLKESQAADAKLFKGVQDMVALLGAEGTPVPANPGDTLKKLAAAAKALLAEVRAREDAMGKLVEAHPVIRSHERFSILVPAGPSGPQRMPLPELYSQMADMLTGISDETQRIADSAADYTQKTIIEQLRSPGSGLPAIPTVLKVAGDNWEALLKSLIEVDAASKEVLAKTGSFAALAKPDPSARPGERAGRSAAEIADAGEKLPKLEQADLGRELLDENLVLVEAGAKVATVRFDDVWPPASVQPSKADDEGPRRIFNGDQAIGGKLLSLTHKPFAEVLVTYFEWQPPAQFRQQMPGVAGDLPREQIQGLLDAMKDAGLESADWNLAGDPMSGQDEGKIPDPPPAKEGLPRILLVLPTPPDMSMMQQQMPLPKFGEAQLKKITDLVDAGTPAIFLESFSSMPPWMVQDEDEKTSLTAYLRNSWGVDVKNRLRVIQGAPSPREVGKYNLDLSSLSWMPLSGFTDNPIGKPMRARQLFWFSVCPVAAAAKVPEGVRVEPIMRVPATSHNVWATADFIGVLDKIRAGSLVGADAAGGDLQPPFDLVVSATRTGAPSPSSAPTTGPAVKAGGRIIVAGVGLTYMKNFLLGPRYVLSESSVEAQPAPSGAIDLLVNACYELSGNRSYIGVGPADLAPVGDISRGNLIAMQWLVVGGWPLLILITGVMMMIYRRR